MLDKNSLIEYWEEAQNYLIEELGNDVYARWIKPLVFIDYSEDIIRFSVSSMFMKNWILTHHYKILFNIWSKKISNIKDIEFIVIISSQDQTNNEEKDLRGHHDKTEKITDNRFSFENFVVGKPNEFAHAAALRISESSLPPFNPFFLYGGVGLGKTHLMHAIALRTKENYPEKKVVYLTSERFMYEFIRSVRYKNIMDFKDEFRSIDVLMIDDIQFISGKNNTQEEFFHTFNALVDENRQVIISADKSPTDLEDVEERLKSRLGWGLVADIYPTTFELRFGILQEKSKNLPYKISEEILEFVACEITSNVRELEGALNKLIAHTKLIGGALELDIAREILFRNSMERCVNSVDISMIQKFTCDYYDIKLSDMLSIKRSKQISHARQVAIYISKIMTESSLPEIGRKFGNRDHTTILYAFRKIQKLELKSQELKVDIQKIISSVKK